MTMPRASRVAARWGPTPWRYWTELVREIVGISWALAPHFYIIGCGLAACGAGGQEFSRHSKEGKTVNSGRRLERIKKQGSTSPLVCSFKLSEVASSVQSVEMLRF